MSRVTNIIVVSSIDEAGVDQVQKWLVETEGRLALKEVSAHASGTKALECDLWAGAYNYLPGSAVVAFLPSVCWEVPENVTVVIEPPEGPQIVFRPGEAK